MKRDFPFFALHFHPLICLGIRDNVLLEWEDSRKNELIRKEQSRRDSLEEVDLTVCRPSDNYYYVMEIPLVKSVPDFPVDFGSNHTFIC